MQPNQFRSWAQVLDSRILAHRFAFCAALGAVAGSGLYYGLPFEPPVASGVVLSVICLLLLGIARNQVVWGCGVFCLLTAATFVLGQVQVLRANPVHYAAAQKPHWLVGTVEEVFVKPQNPKRAVLRLRDVELYGLGPQQVAHASIGVSAKQAADVVVGQGVAIQAALLPPEPPKYPQQRDGRLWRFFEDARVTGYAMGVVEPTERDVVQSMGGKLQAWLEGLRTDINNQTRGMAGGAVTALLTGEEKSVSPQVREAYRNTGLSHLLAISGMQLTLVGLGLFGGVAWLLAWVPNLALRVNIRLIAAVVAMAGVVFYTFLAGASVSLVRATVMSLLVLLAVVSGRMNTALRAWCVAVILILLINPAMVLRAGFQLSIVAVLGLILLAQQEPAVKPRFRRVGLWGYHLLLATVVAGAATAPLVALNFGQFNVVGLLGNLVAVPVMTVATYLGMVALAVWPLGLEHWPLYAMSWVVDVVNAWALWLNGFAMASVAVPKAYWWVLVPFTVAVVVSVLLARWRWACVAVACFLASGAGLAAWRGAADVAVWDGGKVGLAREHGRTYRLVWSVDGVEDAQRMARGAGVELLVEEEPSDVVDERGMPVTEQEDFAWAEKRAGIWHVEPVTCGRPWQHLAEACWK